MSMRSDIYQHLQQVGKTTSGEIARSTGHPITSVTSVLSHFVNCDKVVISGKTRNVAGKPVNVYQIVNENHRPLSERRRIDLGLASRFISLEFAPDLGRRMAMRSMRRRLNAA